MCVKEEERTALDVHAASKKHQSQPQFKCKMVAFSTFMGKKDSTEEDKITVAELMPTLAYAVITLLVH